MTKKVIIVGCDGQDGRLLVSHLSKEGCEVLGISRKKSHNDFRLIASNINILSFKDVSELIVRFKPDEIYYLAAYHHAAQDKPPDNLDLFINSENIHLSGVVNFLESIRQHNTATRLFYAASSHIYKGSNTEVQDESTAINPVCIYGITKASGLFACRMYREQYSIYASVGILYNHESILRSEKFVSRKIVCGAVRIANGLQDKLILGDLDATIDWGYAPDYVKAMKMVLTLNKPDDFIIASGTPHTVREFVEIAFNYLEMDYKKYVFEASSITSKKQYKLVGNPSKIKHKTGWKEDTDFTTMVSIMMSEEIKIQQMKKT